MFLDEVHYYPHWQTAIKNLIDEYANLHIVFSGSSMLQLEAGEGGSLVPWSEPFAQWLYKAGYAETFRQQLLAINRANPEDVYALVDFMKQQIEPPVSTQKKNIRQELFLDNVMPIPPEHNYVKVREYILERCKYDKEFEKYYKAYKRTDSLLFDWFVDPNALGKRMKSKAKK